MGNPENHRIAQYRRFQQAYDIPEASFESFVQLYDIDDLEAFLPANPSNKEKHSLHTLIGVQGVRSGYMDWVKSGHTFELIMQWQELTGNHGNSAMFLTPKEREG